MLRLEILKEAIEKRIHEPDPKRGIYAGNDVGRKLLILARELDGTK
jgi:homoserine dehydrogenase